MKKKKERNFTPLVARETNYSLYWKKTT